MASTSRFSHFTRLVLLAGSLLVLQNCENPGSVGRSFDPSERPNDPQLRKDTISVRSLTTTTLRAYSGNLSYVSVGTYDNPLFGRYEAIGLLQPSLPPLSFEFGPEADFFLKLFIRGVSGDTASTSNFELLEVTRRWRAQAWTLDSLPLTDLTVLHRFTVTNEDSVQFELPDDWLQRYLARHNDNSEQRDSSYVNSMYGFAIRGVDSDKIISIDAITSGIFVEQNDTTLSRRAMTLRQTANSLQHTPSGIVLPNEVTIVENNFKTTGIFDVSLTEDVIGARFPSRVELVVFEDSLTTKINMPPGHIWFDFGQIPIYVLEDYETDFAIFANPSLFVNRTSADASYRSNLTTYYNNLITNGNTSGTMYFLANRFNGIVSPKLFYNHLSNTRKPILIITSFREN